MKTALGLVPLLLIAQDEQLEQAFEGKRVIVKADMPGDDSGIKVYPQQAKPIESR